MKFQIRKAPNSLDASDMFYVYSWGESDKTWWLQAGFGQEDQARRYVTAKMQGPKEVIVAEFTS